MADDLTTYTFTAKVSGPPNELMAGALRRSLGQVIREGVGEHVTVTVEMSWRYEDGQPMPLPPPMSDAEATVQRILSRRPKR